MKRVLVDTNIVIDLLGKRELFYESSQDLFTLAKNSKLELIVSSLSFANTHYILSQRLKLNKVRNVLSKFKVLVTVASFNDRILELSLGNEFKDFEDGIQYFTALENNCEAIITRNKKDFKNSNIPVFNASEFLILNNN